MRPVRRMGHPWPFRRPSVAGSIASASPLDSRMSRRPRPEIAGRMMSRATSLERIEAGFYIYTDHWWRNPKHAVTTEATLVEVGRAKRPTGVVTSGPYSPSPSGYFLSVDADVSDPETGQIVRATGDLYFTAVPFQVGQRIRVRWSSWYSVQSPLVASLVPEISPATQMSWNSLPRRPRISAFSSLTV